MHDTLRRILPLSLILAGFGGAISHAATQAQQAERPQQQLAPSFSAPLKAAFTAVVERADLTPAFQAPEQVWEGKDVDGDGAADFVNPTGKTVRGHDGFGDGEFGASRDGGGRRHEGVDYIARAGQKVVAPISGYVTKIGYAYSGSYDLRFVEISNPALKFEARVFYVDPDVRVGQPVRLGTPIGKMSSLQGHYAGITDHVHLELAERGRRIDATRMIVAKLKDGSARG
ncbi:MAG TPA: M23 family metallopeptidase [Caulobacteraceae bacterium]